MIKAVVFDFDGLIVDTEIAWYESYRIVLEKHGVKFTIEEFSKIVGTTNEALYEHIEKELGRSVNKEELEEEAMATYRRISVEPKAREGVIDYLNEAKHLGLKIGLASSSHRDWVVGYLEKLGIVDYFETIKTADDVEKVKPDPTLYIKAIEELGVSPSEAVAFEDSANGAKAAKTAGLACVIVPNEVTKHLVFPQYDMRINSMSEMELSSLLLKL